MKTTVYNQKLEQAGELELNPAIFEITPVVELIQLAVRIQLANARQGSANTKTRGEVRGGGKKPWKQKGTGNARAGSIRSPIWRHGGITFGPRANRNHEMKMNQKQWRKALYMTLSDKAAENNFLVFSEFEMKAPKTKEMSAWLSNISKNITKSAKKFLLVIPKNNEAIVKSTNNLKNVKVIFANSLNVVDIMNSDAVLATQASLPIIEKTYLK